MVRDSEKVSYYTPYLYGDKFTILQDGVKHCETLEIDFNEVYSRTNTSYKPTKEGYSDYKSASSVERIEAFIKLGKRDPVQYGDENGKVKWIIAKAHAQSVLLKYSPE